MEFETIKGGTGSIASYGSSNPAVQAFMTAMFASDNLPTLSFSAANDVQAQTGGGIAQNGSGIGI